MLHLHESYFDQHRNSTFIQDCMEDLRGVDFDTMVVTGLSGVLAATKLAPAMGKNCLIIRKPHDGTHSMRPAEGDLGERWIFLDDQISSGETRSRVLVAVSNLLLSYGEQSTYVGDYEYQWRRFRNREVKPDA